MAWDIRHAYRVISDLIHHSPEVRAEAASRFPDPVRSWEPGDIFGAIADLGTIVAADSGPITLTGQVIFAKIAKTVAPESLAYAYRIMTNWPAGMKAFVEDYTARRMSERSGVRRTLGDLGRYACFPGKGTPLAELFRAELPGILRQLDLPLYASKQSSILSVPRIAKVSNGEARVRWGISNRVLVRLEQSGGAIVAKRAGKRGMILYDAEKLATSINELRSGIGEDEITRKLGVPAYCLETLADVGLIERIKNSNALRLAGGARLFTRTSFDGLLFRLNDLPKGSNPACTLEEAMFGRLHPMDWAVVLDAVLARSVFTHRLGSSGVWTDRIMVNPVEIAELLGDGNRPLPSVKVSARLAARLLKVAKGYVPAMIENGFLAGSLTGSQFSRRADINLRSVDDFLKAFRTTQAASTRTKLSAPAIAARMRRSGFAPAGRAAKLVIWRKSDFLRVFPELER
jgi:hypothetical protein